MDDERVGSRLDEGARVAVRLLDHEVHLDRQSRDLAHRLYHLGAECEVGNKMAIHHVDVNRVDLRRLHPLDLILKPPEIGREEVGGKTNGSHLFFSMSSIS